MLKSSSLFTYLSITQIYLLYKLKEQFEHVTTLEGTVWTCGNYSKFS